MSDEIDMAANAQAEHLAVSLSRISASIPVGVAGECETCGEEMPRLIDGQCGFCRDGRTPPPGFFDRPAPVVTLSVPEKETTDMPTSPVAENRKITVEGAAMRAIDARAATLDISLKQAADELILAGAASDGGATVEAVPSTIDQFDTDQLLDELRERVGIAVVRREVETALATAIARANAAEGKLAAAKDVLAV